MTGEEAPPRLLIDDRETYVIATLNRPSARNAIDLALVAELHQLCADIEASPRPLVLTGSEGCFAAGADIRQLRERGPEQALDGINRSVFDRIGRLAMPTIAAVDGLALGGGAELAYACDFRLATPRARFGNGEVTLGIIAAAGACWRLRDLVGLPLATEMILAGRVLDAEEALYRGLVSEVVEPEQLPSAVSALVDRILRGSNLAVRLSKLALRAPAAAHPIVDDIAQAVLFGTQEVHERMTAFLEKRNGA
jgi:enoyl-CoA hydratase